MINTDEYQKYIESIVRRIVGMFHGAKLSEEDLRQRGWLELIEAAGRYEAEKGAKFTTYAYRAVAEGIRREAIFQMDRSGVTGKKRFFFQTRSVRRGKARNSCARTCGFSRRTKRRCCIWHMASGVRDAPTRGRSQGSSV